MRSNSLYATCIIIVSFICFFSSISIAGYWVELTNDDFEAGWGNFKDVDTGSSDCTRYTSGTYAVGLSSIRLRDNSGNSSAFEHINGIDVDTPGYTQIEVKFWFYTLGFSNGEDFWVQYSSDGGSNWTTVTGGDFNAGTQFFNDTAYPNTTVIINEGPYTFSNNMKIRFRCDASANQDHVYIDDVVVSGWVDADDFDPPTPNPATFSTAPAADSSTSISMTATIGSDASGPVEYSFVETTGNPGATSSGWTTSNTYTDTGLSPGLTYTYTVQMRDNSSAGINTGTASSGFSATTLAIVPDVTSLAQATAEANIISAGFAVGSITNSFSNTTPLGNVISQTPTAGTELGLGSPVNLNVSKGTAVTDFEDLVAFASNWLDTNCGICNDQDYSGDNDVDFEDYAYFAQEWLLAPPATLAINEFMASNDTIIADGFGEYDDWIEIYNYGTETVIMDGMHLADSGNTYIIPSGVSIDPNEYLIFWADNQDTQGSLHTNFGLSAGGDEITLYDTDGVSLIDGITYKATQQTDISHGRFPDNTPNWYNMGTPTPGATNQAGMADEVWFSKVSGTFISNFSLELFTETPVDEIRYTTDGSTPTTGSTLYTAPISITNSEASRIRARAFEGSAGLAPGPVKSHYYIPIASDIQNFSSNLPIVIIDSFGTNIDNNGGDIWNLSYPYQPVASVFFDLDKDTLLASTSDIPDFAGRAGSRIRGESSRPWSKKQYAFELWDDDNIDEKHSLLGMPSESDWVLNAPYGDKTLMRNVLAYKWGNDIMSGFAAPGTKFVEVFYNQDGGDCSYADYRGIYVLTEKIKVSNNRLDIGTLNPSDNAEPDITGGYILRVDKNNQGEFEEFTTSANMIGNIQYFDPGQFDLTSTQKTWIQNHLNEYETVLNSGSFADPVNGYVKYIDVENFKETDVILELLKSVDGFKLSMYFYKEKNGKIAFGPMWDHNFSSGNGRDPGYPDHWWWFPDWFPYASNTDESWFNDGFGVYGWHNRLMQDFEYKLGTADKWFEHREDKLSDAQIVADIDNNYAYLTTNVPFAGGADNPADRNFNKWNILNTYVECNYYYGNNPNYPEQANLPHTYSMEVEWLKNWFTGQGTPTAPETYPAHLSDRVQWIEDLWASDRNIVAPPALLINSVPMDTGGSIAVGASLTMTAATPGTIYYTLDGTDPRAAGGAIAGTAYSSGITLNETTQVKARIKDGSNWSALNEAVFSDDRVANSLRITEVMYHPVDPNDEYIEFQNIGPATINLAHCQLTKGVNFTFPIMNLAPNAYTIVVRDTAEFNARYPGYGGSIAGEYTLLNKLDNGGENIRLKDAANVIIQEFDYEDNWFPITDGKGFSLNSINLTPTDPNDWNKRLSWEASNVSGGTPGQDHIANTVGNADIVINEILTHTDNSEGDWIELYNASAGSVNVGNWYLSDNKDNLKKYKIASPTNIPSGGYLVLTATTNFQNAADPGSAVQFGLSEHGESVFLTSGDGIDIAGGYSDGESFGSSRNDVTFGRYTKGAPTFNTDFIELVAMTQGAVNSAPYVPDVVITEIMYNAQGIQDLLGEYIELHNRDTGTVYLYDLANPDNTWKFTKGIDFTFPTGVSIGAGQKILISRTHPEAFKVANGDPGVAVYGPFASGTELENDGEKIELSMPTDPDPGTGFFSYIRVEQVNYSDGIHPLVGDPWPPSADGRGDSLHRTTLSDYANDVANWSAGTPTPGS